MSMTTERAFKALLLPATFGQDVEENSIKRCIEDKVAQFNGVIQVSLHRRIRRLGEENHKAFRTLVTQLNGLVSQANWLQGILIIARYGSRTRLT